MTNSGPFMVLWGDRAMLISRCLACDLEEVSLLVMDGRGHWEGHRISALDGAASGLLAAPTFVDDRYGWLASTNPDSGPIVTATRDGGRTWTTLPTPSG